MRAARQKGNRDMAKDIDRPGTSQEWQSHQLDRAHQLLSQSRDCVQAAMKILSQIQQVAEEKEGNRVKAELAAARESATKG